MTPLPIPCMSCAPLGLVEAATHLVRLSNPGWPSGLTGYVCRQHAETLASSPDLVSWERLTS